MKWCIMFFCLVAGWCLAGEVQVDYQAIGRQVWANSAVKKPHAMVRWQRGQLFAEMGLGFVWYPAGRSGAYDESFPRFVAFAEAQGVRVPSYLHGVAPWGDFAAFQEDSSTLKASMEKWLAAHVAVQAQYLVARAHASLPAMMRGSAKPQHVQECFEALARSQQGLLCLVDYLCFMGDGSRPESPRTGLLQVLEAANVAALSGEAPAREFCRAAEWTLRRYAENAPNEKAAAVELMERLKRVRSYVRKN